MDSPFQLPLYHDFAKAAIAAHGTTVTPAMAYHLTVVAFLGTFLEALRGPFRATAIRPLELERRQREPLGIKKSPPPGFCPASVIERVQPWLDLDRPEGRQPQWQQYLMPTCARKPPRWSGFLPGRLSEGWSAGPGRGQCIEPPNHRPDRLGGRRACPAAVTP